MSTDRIRVWVEEIDPPAVLRFSWELINIDTEDDVDPKTLVVEALRTTDGVAGIDEDGDGIRVEINPDEVTRYQLARVIRSALSVDGASEEHDRARIRVWAEDLTATNMLLTWALTDEECADEDRHDYRRVAAWLAVTVGVRSATPTTNGVKVRYDPDRLDRGKVGDVVRSALDDDAPLRDRADALLKRAKTYGNLARKLATDNRISPLPDAAKQAVAARASGSGGRNRAVQTAMRFIPGAALIARVQTLLPLMTELSKWSRDADPAIVDEHLAEVGLDRDTLRTDTITAHEIRHFARDSAHERSAEFGEKASAGARQAIATGRELWTSVRESWSEDDTTNDQNEGSPKPESANKPGEDSKTT